MYRKSPLKSRIVTAFTIQTLIMAVIAYSTIVNYVNYLEETLLYDHFTAYLDAYVSEKDRGLRHVIPVDIKIIQQGVDKVPSFITSYDEGAYEVMLPNGEAYHVISKIYNGRHFILIKDQTEFESLEIKFNHLTLFVLLLFIFTSFLFSRSLAKRIVEPVIQLAHKVKNVTTENYKEIKIEYADDEIGDLIKVIYEHIYTLNRYLQREQWFTGDISHELRTPMMVISSSLDLLKQASTTEAQKQLLYTRIDNAVKNVNELINTFLLLARGQSKGQLDYADENINELVEEVVENLQPMMVDKQINIMIEAEGPVKRSINAGLFSIVLTNLMKNAIVSMQQGDIIISLTEQGFVVEDSGSGLPEMVKQFVNGDDISISREATNHLGLGLSIVKRICEREQWQITAEDRETQGTRFQLRF